MESSLKKASTIFQETSIPTIHSAFIDGSSSGNTFFRVNWQQNDHIGLQKRKFSSMYKLNDTVIEDKPATLEKVGFPTELDSKIILETVSPSKTKRAILKKYEEAFNEPLKAKYTLEIWSSSRLQKVFNLSAMNVHGIIHTDVFFSSFSWDFDEEKLLYVAEEKLPTTHSFFESNISKAEDSESGKQYIFEESWGEMLYEVKNPVILLSYQQRSLLHNLNGDLTTPFFFVDTKKNHIALVNSTVKIANAIFIN